MKYFLLRFIGLFQVSGYVLILSFIVAMIWANLSNTYFLIFHNKKVHFFINEILMTLFFFLVGLEIKRELLIGHLNTIKKALLPTILAFFGAVVPAFIFIVFNYNDPITIKGWGIAMATDIAFAFLTISLTKVPYSIKITLLSIAIIDDIIAVIVIGLFYTKGFNINYILLIFLMALVLAIIYKKFYRDWVIILALPIAWFIFYKSGIHPVISGVFLSFFVKLDRIEIWEDNLDNYVNLIILPIFVLANSGIEIYNFDFSKIFSNLSTGIILGLFFGKQIGITLSALLFQKLKIVDFPEGVKIFEIWAMSIVCAIGFTMSIFISELAFSSNKELLEISKMSIFIVSFFSAIFGLIVIKSRQFF